MPRIYLFTLSFPFGHGETFLENEMAVAHQLPGIEVVLVPFMLDKHMRSMPEGILIDTSLAELIVTNHEKKIYPLIPHLIDIAKGFLKHGCKTFSAIRDVAGVTHHGLLIQRWGSAKLKNGDVAYTYWFDRITFGLARLKSENKINFSLISRVHRYDIYAEYRRHGFIPYRKYVLARVDFIFSISEHGRHYLIRRFAKSVSRLSEKIMISRLGVSDHGLNPSENGGQFVRFVSCSTIIKVKRVDRIARLVIKYAASNPRKLIRWEHFGDGILRDNLLQQIKQLPENLKVTLHGQVSNAEVIEFYRKTPINAFINLSDSEGVPVSIMEAQSFGIPVLARDVGGNGEIVNDQNGRLLTGAYNTREALDALSEIIQKPEKKINAREFFISNYVAEENYREFYNILKKQSAN